MNFKDKHCKEIPKGAPPLDDAALALFMPEVPGWTLGRGPTGTALIRRQFQFNDFVGAMGFVMRLAIVAETEQHHPDFAVHYNRVDVSSWTHTVGGISENDFILAAKINAMGA